MCSCTLSADTNKCAAAHSQLTRTNKVVTRLENTSTTSSSTASISTASNHGKHERSQHERSQHEHNKHERSKRSMGTATSTATMSQQACSITARNEHSNHEHQGQRLRSYPADAAVGTCSSSSLMTCSRRLYSDANCVANPASVVSCSAI